MEKELCKTRRRTEEVDGENQNGLIRRNIREW